MTIILKKKHQQKTLSQVSTTRRYDPIHRPSFSVSWVIWPHLFSLCAKINWYQIFNPLIFMSFLENSFWREVSSPQHFRIKEVPWSIQLTDARQRRDNLVSILRFICTRIYRYIICCNIKASFIIRHCYEKNIWLHMISGAYPV